MYRYATNVAALHETVALESRDNGRVCHDEFYVITRYERKKKERHGGIIDDSRATVTADQIFTTPTSLDVYNFRANGPRRVIRMDARQPCVHHQRTSHPFALAAPGVIS